MQDIIILLQKVLPVFLVLMLGVLLRKKQIISREGINALKTTAVNIALPAVMVNAFATAEYTLKSVIVPSFIFIFCILALILGFLACRLFKIGGRLSPYISAGFEAGMLGYALFAILFPDESASHFAIIDLGQVLFVFTVYKILLAGKKGGVGALREAVTSPVVWGILLGLLLGATGLYDTLKPSGIDGVINAVTDFISAPTSVLILLGIGYDLDPGKMQFKKVGSLILLRLAVCTVLLGAAYLIDRFILGGMMHTGALILMFVLPPPYVLPVFADVESERADISSTLSALTLVSLALFAILAIVM